MCWPDRFLPDPPMNSLPSLPFRNLLRFLFKPALAGVWLLAAGTAGAQGPLPRSTPEAQGVSSAGVRAYLEARTIDSGTLAGSMRA